MPKRSNSRAAGPSVIGADPDISLVQDGEEVAIKEEWIPAFLDTKFSFFDAIAAIPEGGWENVTIYLYRLDPAVANKSGDKKYIDVYGAPITEGSVKASHGGGKYHAFVKYGQTTLRNHRFSIEGEPIFKEGQTLRGGQSAGAPAIPPGQDIGSIVRQVIEATGGNSKAADAGIEVMKRAMMDGMELNKTIVTSQMNSTTGTALGDKLMDALLPRLLAPPTVPATDPIILRLVEAAISNMKADRREPNPAPAAVPASDQLSLVKELMGVDSLREIIDMGRGGREQPWWVGLISNAVEKLPTLLNEFAAMQERGFQRAIIAHQLGAGNVLPPTINPAVNTPPRSAAIPMPPAPTAPGGSGNMSEQMVHAIVDGICRAYDEGFEGRDAAVHITLLYPELVKSLAPLLSDQQQLTSFIASMPPLAERSREPEWPDFQMDFILEIRQQGIPPSPPDVRSPETISPESPPTIQSGAPRKGAPPGKKRANGSAA